MTDPTDPRPPALGSHWLRHDTEDTPPARKKPFGGRRLCAHADANGDGAHWLQPGERCTYFDESHTDGQG